MSKQLQDRLDKSISKHLPTQEEMRDLAKQYPWFDAAQRATIPANSLPIHIKLLREFRTYSPFDFSEKQSNAKRSKEPTLKDYVADLVVKAASDDDKTAPADLTNITDESFSTFGIIDSFIAGGDHKITPKEDTPDFITEVNFPELPDDDDLITEELAEVYLNQGLLDHAKAIYSKLSLLYPKKSIYFAEIIEKAVAQKETK